ASGQSTLAMDQNKMMIDVLAPCLHGPIRYYENEQCLANDTLDAFAVSPREISLFCRCKADYIGDYLKDYGRDLMAYIHTRVGGRRRMDREIFFHPFETTR